MKSRFDWNQLDTKLLMWFDKNMWKWKTNRWHIFMAEGCLPAHLSTKTTMIMRRCPSEVSVEASDMGNPECFAHWVLLINFCFSTPGNEFQIKLKVSWNHDEIKVWSVVWAWLEKSSQFLRSVDIRQLVVRSCGLSPGLSDTQHATVFVGYDHHNLDRSEVWHLLKLTFV